MILDRDNWHEVYVVLSRNPLRTFLTAFGVFWGIFMLIVMLGSGKGLQNGVQADFGSYATNSMFIWAQGTSMPYKGLPANRYFELNNRDVEVLFDRIPEIQTIAPRTQLGGYGENTDISRNNIKGSFSVMGDVPELMEINPKKIKEGRFLNHFDVLEKRKVAVIGRRVKDVLFDLDEDALGQSISINGVYFTVIGVFDVFNEATSDEDEIETIFIPISTFQQAFNRGENIGWMSIMTKADAHIADIEDKVKSVLADQHSVHPDDKRAFGSWNMEKQFLKMQNLFTGINFLIWIVGIGTLLAGVIGISNIMLIVVKERTKEIGVRKALGAYPWSIISQIVLEAITLTSIAGYLGLIAGVAT